MYFKFIFLLIFFLLFLLLGLTAPTSPLGRPQFKITSSRKPSRRSRISWELALDSLDALLP